MDIQQIEAALATVESQIRADKVTAFDTKVGLVGDVVDGVKITKARWVRCVGAARESQMFQTLFNEMSTDLRAGSRLVVCIPRVECAITPKIVKDVRTGIPFLVDEHNDKDGKPVLVIAAAWGVQ